MKIAKDHQNRTANAEPHAVECDIANAINFSNNGDSGYGDNSDNNNNDKTVVIITKIRLINRQKVVYVCKSRCLAKF